MYVPSLGSLRQFIPKIYRIDHESYNGCIINIGVFIYFINLSAKKHLTFYYLY